MTERMIFAYQASNQIIPEWKQAYYDDQTLKKMLDLMEDCMYYYQSLHKKMVMNSGAGTNLYQERLARFAHRTKLVLEKINQFFVRFHECQLKAIESFAQMIFVETRRRFQKHRQICEPDTSEGFQDRIIILENIYIQTLLLKKMLIYNWDRMEHVLEKHREIVNKFSEIDSLAPDYHKKYRLSSLIHNLQREIEAFIKKKHIYQTEEQTRQSLKKLASVKQAPSSEFSMPRFGMSCGFIVFSIILIVYLTNAYNINVQSSTFFENNFAIWRGAGYFVIYFWAIGIGIKVFQAYNINYRLIFALDNMKVPTSHFTLLFAAFATSIYVTMYAFYLLSLSQGFIPQTQLNSFPGYFWLFLLSIFLPLPILYYQSRLYMIKLLILMIISPCRGVDYKIHWITEQFISFKQPLRDFIYTIIFYFDNPETSYEDSYLYGEILALSFFVLRIMQQLRQGCEKKYFGTKLPYATVKCCLGILTIGTSIAAFETHDDLAFGVWISIALVATLYTYFFDLKFDWGLIQEGSHSFFGSDRESRIPFLLNKSISFHPSVYYIIIGLNFIFRLAWTLTISTGVIEDLGLQKYVFTMIISSIQIVRRGIWNILKIERQYLNKCDEFKAMIDYTDVQERVCQFFLNEKHQSNMLRDFPTPTSFMAYTKEENTRKNQHIARTRQWILETEQNQILMNQFLKIWTKQLEGISEQVQSK